MSKKREPKWTENLLTLINTLKNIERQFESTGVSP